MAKFSDHRVWDKLFRVLAPLIERITGRWRHATPSSRYRPEAHYMRGPGPKSLRKAAESGRKSRAA
jgi:hypothetical protein